MKHMSIKMDSPVEFVNVTEINPLISKCQIKVCYVGDEPNRNGSIITKEVATRDIANSLPGSPIVGYFSDETGDFEDHAKYFFVDDNGLITIQDKTRPYGFVDINAKVWFQKYLDDGVEHEYLMTEGYIWTGQYPETASVIENGKGQSMELSEKFLSGHWTKDEKNSPEFFIINSAIISKLCILGDECEPCFEGADIAKPNIEFKLDDKFYDIMNDMKEILEKGENRTVYTQYSLSIGDDVWTALYNALNENYTIVAAYNEGPIVLVQEKETGNYKTVDFAVDGENSTVTLGEQFVDVNKEDFPMETFLSEDEVKNWVEKTFEQEDKTIESDTSENQDNTEDSVQAVIAVCEAPEYIALNTKYTELQEQYDTLMNEVNQLRQFKLNIERQDKQGMIDSFDDLTDEEKADVVKNIDTYSLSAIEEKLSVIARHKNKPQQKAAPTTYSIDNSNATETIPTWVAQVKSIEEELKNA